ncbi:MAG: hypothetical protein ABL931_11575, partial [Usitatibacteraceae bacterium]
RRPLLRISQIIAAVLVCYAGWAVWQPDDALQPSLQPAAAAAPPSPGSIALAGLEAPSGTDFMEHGRLMLAAIGAGEDWVSASKRINNGKPGLEFKYRGNIECWFSTKHDELPAALRADCASPAQAQACVEENAEMLRRYRAAHLLPVSADGAMFKGQAGIMMSKANVVDIGIDVHAGRAEQAWGKWRDSWVHQSRMAGYGGLWSMTAINLVNEGLSLDGLALLLDEAPQLMETHHDELLALLIPGDLSRYNLAGVMRTENEYLNQLSKDSGWRRIVRVNRMRNRFEAYARDFIEATSQPPPTLLSAIANVRARHAAVRASDAFDPVNAFIWQKAMDDFGWMPRELLGSMVTKEAQRRLFTLKLMMARAKVPDSGVEEYLRRAPANLQSPDKSKPFEWDATRRALLYRVMVGAHVARVYL